MLLYEGVGACKKDGPKYNADPPRAHSNASLATWGASPLRFRLTSQAAKGTLMPKKCLGRMLSVLRLEAPMFGTTLVIGTCVIVIALLAIYVPTIYIRKTNKLIDLLEQIAANTRK